MKNHSGSYMILLAVLMLSGQYCFGQTQKQIQLSEDLNLDHPDLTNVRETVQDGNQRAAEKAFLDYFRLRENLYIKVSSEDVNTIKEKFPDEVKQSILTADEVVNRYFLFRYPWDMEKTNVPHQFKDQINWQANPFGDPEWTFMLNRHRYWQDLGKAYLLTGNEKYAKTFVNQVSDWIDKNPITEKTKQTSWRPIEAGIRPENWIKSLEYFKDSKLITFEFLQKFLSSLALHAEYINRDFSKFSQTSNHGVLEFQGLYHIALFLPEFKQAEIWKKDAISNLSVTAKNQILQDGTQWEQSPLYHNEVFYNYTNVLLLSQRRSIKLPQIITDKTKAMAHANIEWQKPNYHEPLLGDSDDNDLRDLLCTAAMVFMDPVLKSRAFPEADYENHFIFDAESKTAYKNLKEEHPAFLSAFQESSGDLYSRSSWEEDAFYSSLHLKRLGGGHSHDDLLHFTLFAFGRDYLVDSGRFSYVDNKWRQYFKDSRSHNTLAVDGEPNSIYATTWSNSFEAKEEGVLTKIGKNYDYAEAVNTAYERLDDPVTLKRRMLYLKPEVWLLVDSFKGEQKHTYSQFFNFPDKNIELKKDALTTTHPSQNLVIQPINPVTIQLQDAWISKEYNLREESTKAEFSVESNGFSSLISLLYFPENIQLSYQKIPVYNRSAQLLTDEEVEAVQLTFSDKEYTLVVAHKSLPKLTTFFYVEGEAVVGEIILIEIENGEKLIHVLK